MPKTMTVRATIAAVLAGLCMSAHAIADSPKPVNIPAGDLRQALLKVSEQFGADLVFSPEQIQGIKTGGAHGELTTEQAVTKLLEGTPLELRTDPSGAMLIAPPAKAAPQASTRTEPSKAFWSRLAQADTRSPSLGEGRGEDRAQASRVHVTSATENGDGAITVEEIVVTAQKKEERLQDVPVPVTAISAGLLVNSNQFHLQEYYTRVPGLSVALGGDAAAPQLTIRGVTTGGFSNPTVGIAVDDISYGSSTAQGSGFIAPDIDPSDLERVEVLRGPQGTLYGASSIGGLLKYVTVDPSTDGVSGHIQGGLSSVRNDAQAGYAARGVVNIPLTETWAVRASAFTRVDPGYVDNIQAGEEGVNKEEASGGRLAALWRPSDVLSLKLSALIQDLNRHGASDVHVQPGLEDLQQSTLRDTGEYRNKIQAYSANLTASLGRAELTSLSGYSVNSVSTNLDGTPLLGPLTALLFDGVTGTPDPVDSETEKFSQELRLSMPLGPRVDWLLGAFYTHEDISQHQMFLAADPATGEIVGTSYESRSPYVFKEYAAFTNFTFHATDRFDVQIGGRQSRNEQDYSNVTTGVFVPYLYPGSTSPLISQEVHSKENAFTYLVTPQLKISPELMIYARLASGYRPGGPTPNSAALGLPPQYDADKTQNYEIGAKGSLLDRAITFDASVYYIDWKDIQLQLRESLTSYVANGSRARSQGIEFAMESRPLRGLTLSGWVSWNDAELTEDLPDGSAAIGLEGDRLPYSSRFSGNLSVDQEFPLAGNWSGFVGGSVSYVGERQGIFSPSYLVPPQRQSFGAYAKTDLRAGFTGGDWTISVFLNNVTDRRGVLRGGLDNLLVPTAFNYIQPRTFGLSLSRTFSLDR